MKIKHIILNDSSSSSNMEFSKTFMHLTCNKFLY